MAETIVINKENAKRLIKDIKHLRNDPIEGIHYTHDETNMLRGYGMIIGPSDSPYEGGYYLFLFDYPPNYPYSPPKLTFYTNDGVIRMHPNLYKNGKVCLSILNTWSGESWTGCQTISSVLLTIRSIMNNTPLLHEPGIDKFHRDFYTYTDIVRYKNIDISMLYILSNDGFNDYFHKLIDIAKRDFIDNYDKKLEIAKKSYELFIESENKIRQDSSALFTNIYNMRCVVDYKSILNKMENTKITLIKKMKE